MPGSINGRPGAASSPQTPLPFSLDARMDAPSLWPGRNNDAILVQTG
jgi:hypothetical protein